MDAGLTDKLAAVKDDGACWMDWTAKREGVMTEADTCREFVTPRLVEAGWSVAPYSIGEQRTFTNGRIIVAGGKVRRGKQKRADYLLYLRRDYPLAVVEAKEAGLPVETGVQQAREYAEILGLKFAYATNGHRIIEIDYTTGTEREVDRFATPAELWQRLTDVEQVPEAAALLPADCDQPRHRSHFAWRQAHSCHPGHGHRKDLRRFPGLLEVVDTSRRRWPVLAHLHDLKNPNAKAGLEHADPKDLIASMRSHELEVLRLLGEIEALVNEVGP